MHESGRWLGRQWWCVDGRICIPGQQLIYAQLRGAVNCVPGGPLASALMLSSRCFCLSVVPNLLRAPVLGHPPSRCFRPEHRSLVARPCRLRLPSQQSMASGVTIISRSDISNQYHQESGNSWLARSQGTSWCCGTSTAANVASAKDPVRRGNALAWANGTLAPPSISTPNARYAVGSQCIPRPSLAGCGKPSEEEGKPLSPTQFKAELAWLHACM